MFSIFYCSMYDPILAWQKSKALITKKYVLPEVFH